MNISKFFCSLVIILLPAYSPLPNLNYHSDVQEDISISEFIVGRWRGEYQETTLNSSEVVIYQLEFTRPNVLVYSKISHQSTKYNVVYRYEFLEKDRIRLEGRLLDEWKLSKDGEFLSINSV